VYELNICIPTFNRKNKILHLVEFLVKEFQGRSFAITVRDNCSSDGTYSALLSKFSGQKNVYIFSNCENLGLGGNLYLMYKEQRSRYIWVIGDDDVINSGIADYLFSQIMGHPGFGSYFLNHSAKEKNNSVIFDSAYSTNKNFDSSLLGIFKDRGSTMMLLSAMIYEVGAVQAVINASPALYGPRLTLPLYMALATSEIRGVFFLRDAAFLENIHGQISWRSEAWKVFVFGVPLEVVRIAFIGKTLYPLILAFRYVINRALSKVTRLMRRVGGS